jgi:hypothetical protein
MRAHPILSSIAVLAFVGLLFGSIAFAKMQKANASGGVELDAGWVLRTVALVAGALILAWRTNKKMSGH